MVCEEKEKKKKKKKCGSTLVHSALTVQTHKIWRQVDKEGGKVGGVVADTAQRAERPAAAAAAAGQISIIATPRRLYAKGGSDRLKPDHRTRIKLSN